MSNVSKTKTLHPQIKGLFLSACLRFGAQKGLLQPPVYFLKVCSFSKLFKCVQNSLLFQSATLFSFLPLKQCNNMWKLSVLCINCSFCSQIVPITLSLDKISLLELLLGYKATSRKILVLEIQLGCSKYCQSSE